MFTGKKLALLAFTGLLPMAAMADISGSNPYTPLPTLDSCSGCIFAYVQFTAANAGQTVLSYQFYNGAGAMTANQLTPILFEKTGDRTFDILGIGATSMGFVDGFNDRPFTATGSATVIDANTFFGYVDGDAFGNGNTGTIPSNYPTGPGPTSYFHAPNGSLVVGSSIAGFNAFTDSPFPVQNNRTYSLQVTTTPEPALYGLLASGLGALVFVARRKRAQISR